MPRSSITEQQLTDHVRRLADEHPPIAWGSVDFTVKDPAALRGRFSTVLDYLARVELEVERNVLELLTIMPHPSEVDREFYADVWYDQEMQHGYILDHLKTEIGLPPAVPLEKMDNSIRALGVLAHFEAIQDVARCMYYLTGASTERQAVLAYNALESELRQMGENAIAETIIGQIKRQEPGHFAFYQMSATKLINDGVLRPWQLFLVRELRSRSYELVGVNQDPEFLADMGEVVIGLGFDRDLIQFAKELGRLEARLLWANRNGMEFPPYFLRALRDAVDAATKRARNGL